jgi:hypothetical protein
MNCEIEVTVFSGKAREVTSKAGKSFVFNEHRVQVNGTQQKNGEPVIGVLTMRELLEPGEYKLALGWYPDRGRFDRLVPFVEKATKL